MDFVKERDYKSLVEKSEQSLPSMYTVTIERLKMAKLVEESKTIVEIKKKQNPELATKKFKTRPGAPSEWLKDRLDGYDPNETIGESSHKNPGVTKDVIPTPIIITNDFNKIFHNSTNNSGTTAAPPLLTSSSTTNLPFNLPPNFQGTIMIQPTIHIHSNGKYIKNEITKYKKIMPKIDLQTAQPNKKRKK